MDYIDKQAALGHISLILVEKSQKRHFSRNTSDNVVLVRQYSLISLISTNMNEIGLYEWKMLIMHDIVDNATIWSVKPIIGLLWRHNHLIPPYVFNVDYLAPILAYTLH